MKYVIINGYPGSGKTLAQNFMIDRLGELGYKGISISSIDYVKLLCREWGWNGEDKTPEIRKFMSDAKMLLAESPWGDVPIQVVIEEAEESGADYIFVDIRESREIGKFVYLTNAITIFIDRDDHDLISNSSDADVEKFDYDYKICNNGGIDTLKELCDKFVEGELICTEN